MERKNNCGIGFCGLLTILLIALKLTGRIDWSWLWVLAPLWIPFLLLVLFCVIVIVVEVWLQN